MAENGRKEVINIENWNPYTVFIINKKIQVRSTFLNYQSNGNWIKISNKLIRFNFKIFLMYISTL